MLELILITGGAVFGGTMASLGTIKLLGGFKPINDNPRYLDADEDDDVDFKDLLSNDDEEDEEEEEEEEEEAPAPKKPVKNTKK